MENHMPCGSTVIDIEIHYSEESGVISVRNTQSMSLNADLLATKLCLSKATDTFQRILRHFVQ